MKIKTKSAKNGVTSTANLALHKDLILNTPKQREKLDRLRAMEVKKVTYEES